MSTCIRRPASTWTTCPCPDCRHDMRRMAKLSRTGRYRRPSSARATVRVLEWLREGYTPAWIASACGIPKRCVDEIAKEFRKAGSRTIGAKRAAAILAADITTGTAGKAPAHGLVRRVQALHRIGWDGATIAARAGISPQMVSYLGNGRVAFAGPAVVAGVRAAYADLGARPGPSRNAVAKAVRRGWASPAAWDDIDTDAEPMGVAS